MTEQFQVITSSVVNVFITSTVSSFGSERRFQKDLTIAALKGKLELLTGGSAGGMHLELYNKDNHLLCQLDDNDRMLGSYPCDDGCRIHVIDKSAKVGEFEDVSKVEKYEMSAEEYEKRADSVRAFKERMKMGRFDPEEQKRREEEQQAKEAQEDELASQMKAGDRCKVQVVKQPTKLGTVMYVGSTEFKPGTWVGVKYDEPLGKNDGSVKGKRYFECPQKYGGFVRPSQVTVGDFAEEGMDFDDDEM